MNNEFTILISAQLLSTITIVISIIALFMHLSKKIDNISKELSDFKDETRKEITSVRTEMADFKTEVRVELVRIQARFDKYDGVNTDLEKRIAEIETQQQQIKEQATASENRVNAILSHANITL